MSHHARRAALPAILVLVAACSAAAPLASPPPSAAPTSASPSATPGAFGAIEHATGATDVILRYDQGGGFVMPGFLASQAPIFTLYGDGTVIFRNPAKEGPPPVGNVFRFNQFRTAKLSEEQIQAALEAAIGEGQLGIARPNYESAQVSDASTAIFTVNAGGLKKAVSVYALGIDVPNMADAIPRKAFLALSERLADFDQGGTITTEPYVPDHYRGVLMDGFGGDPDAKKWPWTDLTPKDFVLPADPNAIQFPAHTLTAAQVAALGIEDTEGGFQGMTLTGPDGKQYSFSLRPMLPDDEA